MQRDPRAFLWDVIHAGERLISFTSGLDFAGYMADDLKRAGVERQFTIIGEALSQLSKFDPAMAARVPDLAQIVSFRNLLIHGYAVIDHDRVWRIKESLLAALLRDARTLLTEMDPGETTPP